MIRKPDPSVLLFDVNETLLDLGPLKACINQLIGQRDAARIWFATMLQYSLAMTVNGEYRPLPDIAVAVLQMTGRTYGIEIADTEARSVISMMTEMTPHDDVERGLKMLKGAGFRLATLTNSSQEGVQSQMCNAGLDSLFEHKFSIETIGKYKPHPEVYQWAAQSMGVSTKECMLVAAHGWDVAGASWAGLHAAFVRRAGQQIFPLGPPPDLIVNDLIDLAGQLEASKQTG